MNNIDNNNNNINKKRQPFEFTKEPKTPYKAQHCRYYLNKNIKLMLILCPMHN